MVPRVRRCTSDKNSLAGKTFDFQSTAPPTELPSLCKSPRPSAPISGPFTKAENAQRPAPNVFASRRTAGRPELNLPSSCSSLMQNKRFFLLDLKDLKRDAPDESLPECTKFRRRMSRFLARCCIMKYETNLFRKKETSACTGGNHPHRPGSNHPHGCANHYHL